MLFKAFFATLLAAAPGIAAPLERRDDPYFTPSEIWKYNVGNGAIYSTDEGLVSKSTGNNGNDITTLLTFTYPDEAAGRQCQFAFYLDDGATLSGSGKLDVFTSNSPAPGPTDGWGPGNQRNIHLGRLSLGLGEFASWDATYNSYLTEKTDCKEPGTTEGFEVVGVYDNDEVAWDPAVAGPRIIYT
ncbi:idi-3 precursor [Fusarium albosuccineum]|uniref:Idi-3 n=1 Tax=Fusarium albosuccineum TaxID=1237068 RepID=A0A8H4PG18_9HYPO|nr:idi-3 precursor [Fusarium albosuccineum]